MFFVGGLVAYLCAPAAQDLARVLPQTPAVNRVATAGKVAEFVPSVQVQQLLAQGGCPGWMALASDPELQATIDAQGVRVYEGPLQQTAAYETSDPPRVKYPAPIRVAASAADEFQAVRPSADDELISEAEDLLFSSPAVAGGATSSAETTAPSPSEPPTEFPPVAAEMSADAAAPAAATPAPPAAPGDELPVVLPPFY
jgi:hypothetical protein